MSREQTRALGPSIILVYQRPRRAGDDLIDGVCLLSLSTLWPIPLDQLPCGSAYQFCASPVSTLTWRRIDNPSEHERSQDDGLLLGSQVTHNSQQTPVYFRLQTNYVEIVLGYAITLRIITARTAIFSYLDHGPFLAVYFAKGLRGAVVKGICFPSYFCLIEELARPTSRHPWSPTWAGVAPRPIRVVALLLCMRARLVLCCVRMLPFRTLLTIHPQRGNFQQIDIPWSLERGILLACITFRLRRML